MKYIYTTKDIVKKFGISEVTVADLYRKYLKKKKEGHYYLFTRRDVKKLEEILE